MYRLAYVLLIIVMFPAIGQTKRDFVSFNKASYELYTQKKWDELIIVGKEALKNNFDFYYLRVRLGIAYYEKGNYAKAINNIKKALLYNDADPAMLEYLYFAYIFSNRYQEASRLYFKHKSIFKNKTLFLKPKIFDYLELQGGVKFSNHSVDQGTQVDNIGYGFIGASLNFKGRFVLYQYVGMLNQGFTDKIFDQGFTYQYPYNFKQFEYYASGNFLLGKGWSINPAYHFIRVNVISGKYNDQYWGISINKNFNKVRLGLNFSQANVYDTDVMQIVPEIAYYPLGNSKLYFMIKNTYNKSSNKDPNNNIYGMLGLKIFKKTWIEGFYANGKAQFLSYDNGYILYNTPDYLISRGGIYLYQYFNNNTQLILSYQLENKEQYNTEDLYSHHFVMIGLNIKF